MFALVIEKFSWCNRRKTTTNVATKKHAATRINGKKHGSKSFEDSDTGKSTDVGDLSDQFIASTDGSDTDTAYSKKFSKTPLGFSPPPGLQAPPGLEAPPGLAAPGSRLNSQAAIFVPSFNGRAEEKNNSQQLRDSIRHVKEALEQWEVEHLDTPQPAHLAGSVQDNTFFALQNALSKLSPQDAATVRTFLDSKVGGPTLQPSAPVQMGWDGMASSALHYGNLQRASLPGRSYCHQSTAHMPNMHAPRPFTPFSGSTKMRPAVGKQPRPPMTKTQGTVEDDPNDTEETLRTHLRDLAQMQSGIVLMVRKINRLGLNSAAALEAYFSKFGKIERTMVSHSRSKNTNGQTRLRPATLGFLVMSSADEVKAILACGEEHVVQGVTILASNFESHPI